MGKRKFEESYVKRKKLIQAVRAAPKQLFLNGMNRQAPPIIKLSHYPY